MQNVNPLDILREIPGACLRRGMDAFAAMPLYRSKKTQRPVYINREIYKKIFKPAHDPSWQEMAAVLTDVFSTTIEPQNGTGDIIATAYADYQADPSGLALSGNQGSGRAYYAGAHFNIKGEKTPLATSPKRQFSDGLLEMERCIWETLVGNGLQGAIMNGLNGVLAVIDMNELCEVVWRDKPVRRGKVIRIDMAGELDRVTHFFLKPQPLSAKEIYAVSAAYGRLEGDKFIERITHGTWSPGNISMKGHLIDFDTVCAVKGRAPVYSSTQWHQENRFGFEYLGQMKVIDSFLNDARVNVDAVTATDAKAALMTAMRDRIGAGFIRLMGFADAEGIYARHEPQVRDVLDLFLALAGKACLRRPEFSLKIAASNAIHAFDFSAFFRVYPLMKMSGPFRPQDAVRLMSDNDILDDPFDADPEKKLTDIEQQHQDAVDAVIGGNYVTSPDDLQMLKLQLLRFVKKYDALHETLTAETKTSLKDAARRAYILNEDRYYLFPAYTLSFKISENTMGWTAEKIDRVIQTLVRSNRRNFDPTAAYQEADIRLYQEGYVCRRIYADGTFTTAFSPFDPGADGPQELKTEDKQLVFNEKGETTPEPMLNILRNHKRESSLWDEIYLALYAQNEYILTHMLQESPERG